MSNAKISCIDKIISNAKVQNTRIRPKYYDIKQEARSFETIVLRNSFVTTVGFVFAEIIKPKLV